MRSAEEEDDLMANPEHVAQLKQGVNHWNRWRGNGEIPYLPEADLSGTDLRGADLSRAILSKASLSFANLSGTDLHWTNLSGTDLRGANLSRAILSKANLSRANLDGANLCGASLIGTDLRGIKLREANLSGAHLEEANLSFADLEGTNLSFASMEEANLYRANLYATIIVKVNLSTVKELATINHRGPSNIELFSVQLPQDGSALRFLRGCGVPDEWIDDYRARMMHPTQYHSCFISYSNKDEALAKRLYGDLQTQGVRCWFAPEDIKIGDKIRTRIDEAIHLQDKLLLLLSEHALASGWIEDEVDIAFTKEREQKRDVLFPVRLDDTIMKTRLAWAKKLRDTRHIGDFTNWTDPQAYELAFERLLRDLKAEGKGGNNG